MHTCPTSKIFNLLLLTILKPEHFFDSRITKANRVYASDGSVIFVHKVFESEMLSRFFCDILGARPAIRINEEGNRSVSIFLKSFNISSYFLVYQLAKSDDD